MKIITLYKRNVNGSINQWSVYCEDDKYWTEYGQVDGILTKSDVVVAQPKSIGKINETSAEEQALKEAQSLISFKLKSENYVSNIDEVDVITFQPPMLAKVYDERYTKEIKFIQPKLDGIRCNMHYINGNVEAISRKNNPFYTVEHIKKSLEDVLKNNPSIHLDGELYNHLLHANFNSIVSLVKKQKINEEQEKQIVSLVRYNVYDLWDDNNPNMTFEDRFKLIDELLANIPYVDVVQTISVENEEEIDKYFRHFVSNGYEGAILRTNGKYEHKRSKNLLKYKKFDDDEFEILDICEGKIKNVGEYAIIQLKDNQVCKATLGFSDDICNEMLKNKENYIGKLATVRFFGYTEDKKLRFPVLKSIRDYE